MQIISFTFLIFFAITLAGYYLLPGRLRAPWLLAASYVLYVSQGPAHTAFLLFSTITTWGGGLLLSKARNDAAKKRTVLVLVLAANFLVLFWCKYIGLFSGGRITSFILPVGISFYTLQAAGYLIDVYKDRIQAEKNFIRYALFVSFFPTVLSGPIERGPHMLPQFQPEALGSVSFDADRVRDGLVRMLYGYFCKMVLADHLAVAVNTVYASPADYGGAVLFVTSVLYSLQIYLDFAGYSSIAVGAAKALGIEVMENFDAPYLARSISGFWRRWHISLSTWLRDYLYIPLGGNRRGQARRIVNLLIVFLLSGLWHGAGWTFLLWGLLHGLYQAAAVLLGPILSGGGEHDKKKEPSFAMVLVQTLFTFLLVDLAWIFFRLPTLGDVAAVFAGFARPELFELMDGTLLALGLNAAQWRLVIAGLAVVFVTDLLHTRGIRISEWLGAKPLLLRWPVYLAGIVIVVVCGVWGAGYDAASFIYYQF